MQLRAQLPCNDCLRATSNGMHFHAFGQCVLPSLSIYVLCSALQIQVQLQELLLQFCSAEVFTPPTKVRQACQ